MKSLEPIREPVEPDRVGVRSRSELHNTLMIIPTFLILTCIVLAVYYGMLENMPETNIEYHKVVGVMDSGEYLMESPDGNLYIYDDELQNLEPGNYIMIQSITEGNRLANVAYIILGVASVGSLLMLLGFASGVWDEE